MRVAMISDIHGNLDALEAVLSDVTAVGCDEIRCLGDIVGYGADPELCVRRVRDVAIANLLGNHDAVAVGVHSDEAFNELAREAIQWTRAALSPASTAYLRQSPMYQVVDDLFFTHASPLDTGGGWPYVFPGQDVSDIFAGTEARVMFIGHTHVPGVANDQFATLSHLLEGKLELDPERRYLINVGSVGQPRDRDPRAAWGLLDVGAGTYEQRRVEYDIPAAQRKIRDGGLPDLLAERLSRGV